MMYKQAVEVPYQIWVGVEERGKGREKRKEL